MAEESKQDQARAEDAAPDQGGDAGQFERQGCLARITPVSTPGCASCLTSVLLVITVAVVWGAFLLDPDNVPWRHSMNVFRVGGVLLLTALIPFVVYKLVYLWMEGEPSPFPDLDYAWNAGLHALASNGLSIRSIPVYVVVGSSGEQQERALINASGRKMRVEGVPEGPSPIHWYANPDAIFIFCSDASWTSALASLREELEAESAASGIAVSDSPLASSAAMPVEPQTPSSSIDQGGSDYQGTLMLDQFVTPPGPGSGSKTPPPSPADSSGDANIRGTMSLSSFHSAREEPRAYRSTQGEMELTSKEPVLVSPQYSSACLQELQYLGTLLRRIREPICGINGVLALIQLESIHSAPNEREELQKAIKADVTTIQYALQLSSPVTALIVGLEKERGFRELVRRVGRDRAATQRFGRRFDVRAIPTAEELAALSLHVCGAFEDWAYTLFREEEALSRPGNTRLYELLSKVRCSWKKQLGDILANGFGCDNDPASQENSILFSGCYLAATGNSSDRQAFVRGVIDKLDEEQELVQWTDEAVTANRRQNQVAAAGIFLTLILAVVLIAKWAFNLFS